MKITLHGGPNDGETADVTPSEYIKAWLGLRANNPRAYALGSLRHIETVELEPENGYRRYKVKPGPNGHIYNPVRRGLKLRWEYGGTTFCAGHKIDHDFCGGHKP